jgi:hypothetical protein
VDPGQFFSPSGAFFERLLAIALEHDGAARQMSISANFRVWLMKFLSIAVALAGLAAGLCAASYW